MTALQKLFELPRRNDVASHVGMTSVCSAHPLVIEATMRQAIAQEDSVILIEATCNQVNQDGGYTGMTPTDFRAFVGQIAGQCTVHENRILYGGDHLGPNPWRKSKAADAMAKAQVMVHGYAKAGFGKIHLDASMACADDVHPLLAELIASRAAVLAQAAEQGAREGGHAAPAYIVGTEVPVPGGAAEALEVLHVTEPSDAAETWDLHRRSFRNVGLESAFARIIGLVVQPGVEFGHSDVIHFDQAGASALARWRNLAGTIVFEAHSTDYQRPQALAKLVEAGFAILKVGPGLTFALREAYYALDQIAGLMVPSYVAGTLPLVMEQAMLAQPADWDAYYVGSLSEQKLQRQFSYSDRIRYYWAKPKAQAAVANLFAALADVTIPETLISHYLSRLYPGVVMGTVRPQAQNLAVAAIQSALSPYADACRSRASAQKRNA